MIKDILVSSNQNIREAMRAIDKGSLRTAFVVSDNKLIGTVSDGDIRRGLLSSLNMEDSIKKVTNFKPIFLRTDSTKEQRKQIIENNDLLCLPILSQNDEIIDVVTLRSLLTYKKRSNPVFIMAGGFGTRLRPLTDNCPKPMLPIGDKPMLEHIINLMKNQGFHLFFISTHYLPEKIIDYLGDGSKFGISIEYVHEEFPLGTAGALSLLPDSLTNDSLIMMNGDILTDLDFTKIVDFHEQNSFDATMCVREQEYQISYGVVDIEDNIVTGMREKPTYQYDINTGIYVLSKNCFSNVKEEVKIDMPTYLEKRISDGFTVGAHRHNGYWLDIGQMSDYQKAQRDIKEVFS